VVDRNKNIVFDIFIGKIQVYITIRSTPCCQRDKSLEFNFFLFFENWKGKYTIIFFQSIFCL
jgi:hypothetical protein